MILNVRYDQDHLYINRFYVPSNNPRLDFARFLQQVNELVKRKIDYRIGEDVAIDATAVVGTEGFSYERLEDGTPIPIPHIGGVWIGDRVRISSHCHISRGTIGPTIIDDDTKLSHGVHVAHNVHIGKRCIIAAEAVLTGSCRIENDCFIGAGSCISNDVIIGKGSIVGIGAVVIRNVIPGTTVVGNPAKEIKKGDWNE